MEDNVESGKVLIYGAYGYTGELVVRKALIKGLQPILAGRNAERLEALANANGLPMRTFSLDSGKSFDKHLDDIDVVIHCAGPFSRTAAPMAEACIRTRTHYLDITGEIEVFEMLAKKNQAAKLGGIMLLPGTGFDVVPSDCLAKYMKGRMPGANKLRLCIYSQGGGVSHGTAATMAENAGKGGTIRREGKLINVPTAWNVIEAEFNGKTRKAVSIPWGDVSTAWYSTGIPNIECYAVAHPKSIRMMKISRWFGWLLNMGWVQRILRRKIDKNVTGPDDDAREKSTSSVWAEISNSGDKRLRSVLTGPNGYTLTAMASVYIAQQVLAGNFKKGFQTPSLAYGQELILEFPGTEIVDLN